MKNTGYSKPDKVKWTNNSALVLRRQARRKMSMSGLWTKLRFRPSLPRKSKPFSRLYSVFTLYIYELGDNQPSNPLENCIIILASILQAGIPIPFPRDLCKLLHDLNIIPGKHHRNAFRFYLGLAVFETLRMTNLRCYSN